jgi:hypothetical protein
LLFIKAQCFGFLLQGNILVPGEAGSLCIAMRNVTKR